MASSCPKCGLKVETIWQCDGCGYEFRKDYARLRTKLRANIRSSRIAVFLSVIVDLAAVAGIVMLAMHGWIYVSVPLVLGAIGLTKHSARELAVNTDDLRRLDLRHVPLPKAIMAPPEDC